MNSISPWIDEQVPTGEAVFIDHIGYFVHDLDDTALVLERLGFAPSTVNLQSNLGLDGRTYPAGTSNRLVRLRRGFLEFLAATHDTPLAEQLKAAAQRYEGLHLIAFSNADLSVQRERLVGMGFLMGDLVEMRRTANEPGATGTVGWSVLRTAPGMMPEGRIQYAYPRTPELTWPPGSMTHPNAADSLTGVLICVDNEAEVAERYERFVGRQIENGRCVTDRGILRVVSPTAARLLVPRFAAPTLPFIAAISIESRDIDATRCALGDRGVDFQDDGSGQIWVGTTSALGSYMCFHAAGSCPF